LSLGVSLEPQRLSSSDGSCTDPPTTWSWAFGSFAAKPTSLLGLPETGCCGDSNCAQSMSSSSNGLSCRLFLCYIAQPPPHHARSQTGAQQVQPVAGQQCAVIWQARYSRAPRWPAMRTLALRLAREGPRMVESMVREWVNC
jgi:hypothetical protein